MLTKPLVSVIVPTKDSAQFLDACLRSITAQTYGELELIVVDNHSADATLEIAKQHTPHVYTRGPERSAQRNYGVSKATGRFVAVIDSDMELTPRVIESAVQAMLDNPESSGIIIPEESFGIGFWAKCKALERSFYVGVPWIEAARFFPRDLYQKLGGYDEALVAGEDWDLSHRAEAQGPIAHVTDFIRHNEGHLRLGSTLKKKYYYAQHAKAYLARNPEPSKTFASVGPVERYKLFLSSPRKLFSRPAVGSGMLMMKTFEFSAGALGYAFAVGGLRSTSEPAK
jgi:glycosyltransferase involved in cell wall biosynthesis